MTISLAGITGACAAIAAIFLASAAAPAAAQSASNSSPLSLASAAHKASMRSAPKSVARAKAAPVAVKKAQRAPKAPNRGPAWNTFTMGNADLAFLSAGQYLDLSVHDDVIAVVAENEFSLLDFAAGNVRIVDPDEVTEIDLANDPDVLLAQRPMTVDPQPVQQVTAAPPSSKSPDEDDGILNRILMTFAGALALAGAMKMILA